MSEWIVYMKYLKNNYPFLFSLAVRTNPFDVRGVGGGRGVIEVASRRVRD